MRIGDEDNLKSARERLVYATSFPQMLPAVVQPASDVVPTAPSKDTVSKAISASFSTTGRSRPELDKPRHIDSEGVKNGMEYLEAFMSDDSDAEIDLLTNAIFLIAQDSSKDALDAQRQLLAAVHTYSEAKNRTRLDEMQKQSDLTKKVGFMDTIQKGFSSFGLIGTGLLTALAGSTIPGAALVIGGTLFLVDQLLDDKAKKTVATWVARGNKESEEMWVERIHLFCSVTSAGLSLGFAPQIAAGLGKNTASAVANVALGVAQGGAKTIKSSYDSRLKLQRGFMVELDAACNFAQKDFNRVTSSMQLSINTVREFIAHHSQVQGEQESIIHQFSKSMRS